MKSFIIFFLVLFIATSASANNAKQAVNDYCSCAKPAYKKHKEILEAFKKHMNQPEKAQEIFKKIEKETQELAKCFQNLNEKYNKQQKDVKFQKKVNAGIKKQCPKPKIDPIVMKDKS